MQFVRHIDDLGRVVIPKIIREKFGVSEGDLLEITMVNKDYILIAKTNKNKEICNAYINKFTEEEQKEYDKLLADIINQIESTKKNIKELGFDEEDFEL